MSRNAKTYHFELDVRELCFNLSVDNSYSVELSFDNKVVFKIPATGEQSVFDESDNAILQESSDTVCFFCLFSL